MNNIARGLCWAAAILVTVIAKGSGLIDAGAADTLLLVLPIIAVLSLRNQGECRPLRRKEA